MINKNTKLKIISREELVKSSYTTYCRKYFLDEKNNKKEYTFIKRNLNQRAVVVIPKLIDKDEIILIKQFRIPFEDYFIEFPAGLIEIGEKIEDAVIRELKEEAGAYGVIKHISKEVSSTPGLTDELVYFVFVEVVKIEKNSPEHSEDIEVILVNKEKWEEIKIKEKNIQSWVYLFCESFFNKTIFN
ncbi:MAG: NUDIX hydrolase [Spirochaetes bacterium]|nr:NUDIX hydrolase [Spirochaetota bacterium]